MKNFSTGRFGWLFLNVVTLESRSPGSVVIKKRNTTNAGTLRAAKHSSMTLCDERRGGFTLIELLVVVLIIGILASIALPKYRVAVARTRYHQQVVMATSLSQAIQRYYMANAAYPTDVRALDIQVAGTVENGQAEQGATQTVNGKNFHCTLRSYYLGSLQCSDDGHPGVPGFSVYPDGQRTCCPGATEMGRYICRIETGRSEPDTPAGCFSY